MKKKVLNILLIISAVLLLISIPLAIDELTIQSAFFEASNLSEAVYQRALTVFIRYCIWLFAALFGLILNIMVLITINRAELSYTKDEIAAKVAAMKQARQERKQSAQREKEEQKKADLQRQLDELNKKDGE